jgi:hypothetical protein
MSEREKADLALMVSYLTGLKTLRDFVDRLEMLFEEDQSEVLAWARHAALLRSGAFLAVPELAAAIGMLAAEKFAKMIAFLKSPACRRVRTNNHVERVNRKLRHQEKARYKWRKRLRIVGFLMLLRTAGGARSGLSGIAGRTSLNRRVQNRSSPKAAIGKRVA